MEEHISTTNGPPLPLSCLRLFAPPLRVLSAAIWQTVKQRVVLDYGMLEEFVSMITELVPDLLPIRPRVQLMFGLRARLILELCRFERTADLQVIQPHLEKMKTLTAAWASEATAVNMELTTSNFTGLVHILVKSSEEREHFFKNVFPKEFGSTYDEALHTLMWQFLTRLEKLFPLPTLKQVASMLGEVTSVLTECMDSMTHCQELKTLLQYQKELSQLDDNDCSFDATCIMSALNISSLDKTMMGLEKERSEVCALHEVFSFTPGMENELAAVAHTRQIKTETAVVNSGPLKDKSPDVGTLNPLAVEITNNEEDEGILPNNVEDKCCFKKDCRVMLERLETRSLQSRPVRHNRGLKMKMILKQEKRGIRKKNPACKAPSPLQAAVVKSSNITKTSPCGKSIPSSIKAKPASEPPLLASDDEDSVRSYKDPSYITPAELSEEESSSNSSDGEPCDMGPRDNNDASASEGQCNPKAKHARKPHTTQRGRCCICKEHVKGDIMDHMKVHFPDGEYTCPRCDTKFTILSSLKLHLRRTCYDQQQVDPGEAGAAQSLFKCDECEKAFRYKLSLDEHKRTHNQLYCEVCRKVLRDQETLERHKASHTLFECTLCEESFRLYKPLARHYENIHKLSRPYKCNHCPKSFTKLRYFIWHEWRHTGQLPFQCWHCSQRFKHDTDLVSHLRVHTREKPFLCADCGKAFSSRSNLRRHLNFVHSQSHNERRFSCTQCEKSFKEKGALKKHEKTKHLHELFFHPCLYCGKLFSSSAMGRHKLIHTGEKPFKCKMPECDKHFRSTTEVKRHIMQHHTSERPFKCKVCEKGFVRAYLLNTHMHVHSGEKPHVCSICGKAFPQLYSMKRHKKLVHTFVA